MTDEHTIVSVLYSDSHAISFHCCSNYEFDAKNMELLFVKNKIFQKEKFKLCLTLMLKTEEA